MRRIAEDLQSSLETRQDAPGFKRYALIRPGDGVVVDLVYERAAQLVPEKSSIDGIVVDPREEILANKITALVGRMEERDLVDVYFLERAGLHVEDYLDAALAKDAGATPAALAWLLSEISIPDEAKLPGGLAPSELRAYLTELVKRLRLKAFPAPQR
jgi:hypothetical protein